METLDYERDFILDPACVLYLPFRKKDGAQFMSDDRYGHLCTKTGAIWTPQGHYFDGIDDKIYIPAADSLIINGKFSLLVCITPPAFTGSYRQIYWQRHSSPSQGMQIFLTTSANTIIFARWLDGAAISANAPFTPGLSQCFMFTYDGSNSRIQVDGALGGTGALDNNTIDSDSTNIYIASAPGGNFTGAVYHELILFKDRVISEIEFQRYYEFIKWRFK